VEKKLSSFALKKKPFQISKYVSVKLVNKQYCTSCLIQSVLDSLKLSFKLLVLKGKPTIGILE
jgi:hypothetical protein